MGGSSVFKHAWRDVPVRSVVLEIYGWPVTHATAACVRELGGPLLAGDAFDEWLAALAEPVL